jgi:ribose/xylose/arabinose/galactoside ABC-type transport system permease subunit
VHAAVVLTPLAAVLAVVYGLAPTWRWAVRWPMVGFSLAALASVMVAWFSGRDLLSRKPELEQIIQPHQERADILLWVTIVFVFLVLLGAMVMGGPSGLVSGKGAWGRRPRIIEATMATMLVTFAVVLVLMAFQTGEQGARLVWG